MDLQPTYGYFEAIGIVTGLSSTKSITEGDKDDYQWKRLQFGIKVNHNAFVYVELMGTKTAKVKAYPVSKDEKDNEYILVNWNEVHRVNPRKYRMMHQVKMNIDNKSDSMLLAFEAIEYLKNNLQDGDSVVVRGTVKIEEYNGEVQEKFIVKSIYSHEEVDFDSKDYQEFAYFNQEIVYEGIEKIEKSKYKLNTKIIISELSGYKAIPYTFQIYETSEDSRNMISYFSQNIVSGSTLKVHGSVKHYVPIVTAFEGYRVVSGPSVKELVVTGGNVESIIQGRYSINDLEPKTITGSPFEDDVVDGNQGINKFGF
jgi:hypothetical protein